MFSNLDCKTLCQMLDALKKIKGHYPKFNLQSFFKKNSFFNPTFMPFKQRNVPESNFSLIFFFYLYILKHS